MAKPNRLESYPWYPCDWRSDPAVVLMNSADRGLYRDVLDIVWEHGSITNDPQLIRKMACIELEDWEASWPRVQAMFIVVDGHLRHSKVDARRPKCLEMKGLRSEAGRRGGQASVQAKLKQTLNGCLTIASTVAQANVQPLLKQNSTTALALAPALTTLRVVAFSPDVEKFEREFPQTVSDLDVQNFISQIGNEADQKLFFAVLAANKLTRKWREGFHPSAKTYLTTGLWRKMPKLEGTQDAPTMYLPLERE